MGENFLFQLVHISKQWLFIAKMKSSSAAILPLLFVFIILSGECLST